MEILAVVGGIVLGLKFVRYVIQELIETYRHLGSVWQQGKKP
jgi:hypothetical protein